MHFLTISAWNFWYLMLNRLAQGYGINNTAMLGYEFAVTGAYLFSHRGTTHRTRRVNLRGRVVSPFQLFLLGFFSIWRGAGTARQNTRVSRACQYLRSSR